MLTGCSGTQPRVRNNPSPAPARDTRLRFNQLALRLDLPLFWAQDANGNGAPDPSEVRSLWFYPTHEAWVADGRFTPAYEHALAQIRTEDASPTPTDPRERLVRAELDHAAPTLVETELSALPPTQRAFAEAMLVVAARIDDLYAIQTGAAALADRVRGLDPASRSLFRRNWGPRCLGAETEREPLCSAIPGQPRPIVDVYPASMQSDDGFCRALEARAEASALLTPFTVVREENGALRAVPYTDAWPEPMRAVASALRAAADVMTDADETPLVTYLRAAARAFETNDWAPADEAWSQMNARNSSWYVRAAPDETYWEPCSHKAGFHLTFARIDRESLGWQERLTPLQNDMERAVAALAAGLYTARTVAFHMPDFIDIVANAGDDRDAFGATVGQSLPNWGAVASQGRGRTVAMSNLYTDPDSSARRRAIASSLFDAAAMTRYTDSATPALLSTILHEATHNLGPANEYRLAGRTADDAFGGALASTLEELKAQSGALFFVSFLRERGVIDAELAERIYVDSIAWTFGHIARGMYTSTGERKPYSQLAAMQIGFLLDDGALAWDPQGLAADGVHHGAFRVDFARLPAACQRLMERVMHIKATNDRAAAEEFARRYVDGDRVPRAIITQRSRAFPQTTFVYGGR
jgi:hypothetical protein